MIFSKFARSKGAQAFSLTSYRRFHQSSGSKVLGKSSLLTSTLLTSLVCYSAYSASSDSKNGFSPLLALNSTKSHCNSVLSDIKNQLDFIEGVVTNWSFLFTEIDEIKKKHPNNLMAKHFSSSYFLSLSAANQKRLYKIVKSGLENPTSSLGCYAMNPTDYDDFKTYLDLVIRDYHKIPSDVAEVQHITNWKVDKGSENLDLTKLGLKNISMRVRVGRNLQDFPLPGAMTKDDRINLEKVMIKAFKKLMADKRYGGNYYSLTPDTEYSINDEFYLNLVKSHIMFKDMDNDPYLKSAGISSDWPYGRGCYVSQDKEFIVWVGEEDHLRIMCMKKGNVLNEVFNRLSTACDVVEQNASKFAHSKNYGYVTSCPTNLGTGMRASVHIKVPNLTSDGTETKAKAVAKPLGLSVRGVGGEHTPIGADGTIDISPSARLCIEEREIIKKLYEGIKLLLKEEEAAKSSKSKL